MAETPKRGAMHEALSVFLGKWTAHGTSYGGTDQTCDDPKAMARLGLAPMRPCGTLDAFSLSKMNERT
jgi:hypothetical protein